MEERAGSEGIEARYRFVARVGSGSSGDVHRGVEVATGRPVAIKRLRATSIDPQGEARLAREARLLARVEHPNVVRVLDHGLDATGRPCLVLEWLEGEDLARRQLGSPVDVPDAVEIVRQAALGLDALHAVGIVHRDVKPANFFVLASAPGHPEPRVKLIDLGISRADDETSLTTHGLVVGSPAYMSPEQARGEEPLTPASDQFSLGVLLFELLVGHRPFRGADPFAVLAKIVLEAAPRLRDASPDLSPELDAIVLRVLSRAPNGRFSSCRALAEALASLSSEARAPRRRTSSRPTARSGSGPSAPGANVQGAIAPTKPSPPQPAPLAAREQRVVTAIFAAFGDGADGGREIEAFSSLVGEHGGLPVRTLGRRAIGLFGSQRSNGDEAVRAARAALAAHAGIPGVRLSIATGRALTGAEGLSGEALDRAARALDRAMGAVRVDEPTARLLEAYFSVTPVDAPHEGLDALAPAVGVGHRDESREYVLHPMRTLDDEGSVLLLGRRTTTVGRDRELSQLSQVFDECAAEPVARAVLVTAPAGAGKTRLLREFLRSVRAKSTAPQVLYGRGDSLGVATPFGPIADALRRTAGMLEHEPLGARREKLRLRVERALPARDARRVTEFLGEVVGVPAGDGASDALRAARGDAVLMGDAIRESWEDFLFAECASGPVLLVLEDLQWADGPTIRLVSAALRRLASQPFLALALARPEVHRLFPGIWQAQGVIELRLGPLTRRASERLVREALGEGVESEVIAAVVDRAEGHAFYLEELIRAVASEGAERAAAGVTAHTALGTRDDGHAPPPHGSSAGGPRVGALPATVLGMVQARLDALPADARRVLRAASVYGQRFWRGGVVALFGPRAGATPLNACLDELVSREVIVRKSAPAFEGETEFHFSHALLREAAYASLTDEDRVSAHRVAAQWLERVGEADATVLAAHYDRGCEPRRAAGWYCVAAEQALDVNDFHGAIERADLGARCLSHDRASTDGGDDDLRGMLRLLQADAHAWRGEFVESVERADEALECLPRGSAAWFRAVRGLVAACGARGIEEPASAWARAARDEPADTPESRAAKVSCLARVAEEWVAAGRVAEAEELLEHVAPWVNSAETGRFAASAAARMGLARSLCERARGRLDGYLTELENAVDGFDQADDGRNLWRARCELGWGYARMGDVDRGESLLRSAMATAERSGLAVLSAWARRYLAAVCVRTGRVDEALSLAQRAIEDGVSMRSPRLEGGGHTVRAWVAYEQGDFAACEAFAMRAAACFEKAPSACAGALALAARALLRRGDAEGAVQRARAAIECDERAGGASGAGEHARGVLADALAKCGDDAGARAAAREASDRLLARARSVSDPRRREGFLSAIEAWTRG